MTLVEFLLARILELEDIVRYAAADPVPFFSDHVKGYAWEHDGLTVDPVHVLAECATKRRIIAEHPSSGGEPDACGTCCQLDDYPWRVESVGGHLPPYPNEVWPCLTLRLLAAPYADHDDFDPTWSAE